MWQKNNGKSETDIIQNQFTAYLTTAVKRRKNDYIQQIDKRQQIESLTEDFLFMPECGIERDMLFGLPVLMQLEDSALLRALKGLSERERYIFLERALDGKSFEMLAEETGLAYKGVAAVYYRAIQKIKKKIRGDEK
ncbi:sigma-70 family RNA polymerase sigma factor [Enterocloster clostridioformis]|uniref:Sigma-70, region 4 n=1 Tax=Enterocloster clostridioformis TaxID=1531 RepID=A0A2X2U0U4_9FIRM|nr:sigma-70 family RNA polymerase sigma factor [Enterocloster clostridioformis]MCA5577282.1 sigma-70 family RNA polymerase sigma factor [Enterocloster clostridioformis]SQB10148.1 Sigma-70, region 4 [Enterocloster clostridioformis]